MMMMLLDPKDKISESMDSSSRISPGLTNEGDKTCSNCNTTKTPLWRGGPAGPKSLCNACGIKYNKKRRTLLGLDQERTADKNMKKKKKMANGAATVNKSREKLKLMAVGGGKMLLPRLGKQMINLNEEEQAAILLMALSYGSVFS